MLLPLSLPPLKLSSLYTEGKIWESGTIKQTQGIEIIIMFNAKLATPQVEFATLSPTTAALILIHRGEHMGIGNHKTKARD